MSTSRITRDAITPRREYHFGTMKKGDVKKISIPPRDEIAGLRALTAAYAFARRHNAKVKRSRKGQLVKFAGRTSPTGKVMAIARVR